ncbi:hypothetical protein MPH_02958 [Macrophomina phaseolina MS6]|uniref:Rhodopsin domain-containing protein n=1 Tax=Macrophomina phaseolina (strain MS6) TaxID=1126212 RepID=K2RB55_MACPH|nr:hypothetical protein MPH_02958 [Macrophomina phaseolina MS6]
MLAKLSVAFLQLRVIGLSTLMLRRIHYATVVINLVIGLYEFFTLLFQCYPNGDPIVIFGNAHKCTTRRPVVISVYIYSAVNILLDWYYSFAIVPLIWRLQNMRTVVKVSVIVILGMGFL